MGAARKCSDAVCSALTSALGPGDGCSRFASAVLTAFGRVSPRLREAVETANQIAALATGLKPGVNGTFKLDIDHAVWDEGFRLLGLNKNLNKKKL